MKSKKIKTTKIFAVMLLYHQLYYTTFSVKKKPHLKQFNNSFGTMIILPKLIHLDVKRFRPSEIQYKYRQAIESTIESSLCVQLTHVY